MTTSCARCYRPAPPEAAPDYIDWDALGPDGAQVVCPECVTGAERQAMDEGGYGRR